MNKKRIELLDATNGRRIVSIDMIAGVGIDCDKERGWYMYFPCMYHKEREVIRLSRNDGKLDEQEKQFTHALSQVEEFLFCNKTAEKLIINAGIKDVMETPNIAHINIYVNGVMTNKKPQSPDIKFIREIPNPDKNNTILLYGFTLKYMEIYTTYEYVLKTYREFVRNKFIEEMGEVNILNIVGNGFEYGHTVREYVTCEWEEAI